MAYHRRKKVKYGHSVNLSFTPDELHENVSAVAIERVSTDGRRIHRSTRHVVPSPKKKRTEGQTAFQAGLFLDSLPDFDNDPVGSENEDERIKPRAKRYLSSVLFVFLAFIFWVLMLTILIGLGQSVARVATISG
jgi:hypothetical protein